MAIISLKFGDTELIELLEKAQGTSTPRLSKKDVAEFREKNNNRAFIGNRISYRRKELGLAQSDVAMIFGVTRELISMIETGRSEINAGDLNIMGKILNVPADYFLDTFELKMPLIDHNDPERHKTKRLVFLFERLPDDFQDAVLRAAQAFYDTLRPFILKHENESTKDT